MEMENNNIQVKYSYEESFTKPIIKYGRITNLLGAVFSFIPAIIIWIFYGELPTIKNVLTGWFLIASIYGVYYIVEPVSYFPVLGLPGTYMSFLAGNIGNMRVPCSAIAQEAVGVEPGTKKAELVSTIGIIGSIIVNLIVVTIAAFAGAWVMSILPPTIIEAFNYVTPAIYGSMFAMYAVKKLPYGIFAAIVTMFMLLFTSIPAFIMIPISVFSTIAFAIITNNRTEKKEAEK